MPFVRNFDKTWPIFGILPS